MHQPPLPRRNPLDQAFWGLIVSICVVMGAGICVMSLGNQPQRVAKASDGGGKGKGSNGRDKGKGPVGVVEPDPGVPEPTPPVSSDEAVVKFVPGGIVVDQEKSDPSGKPLAILPVSNPNQLTSIEQRLDVIANNLGALQESVATVKNSATQGRLGADSSVEFVREFRYLLETGHRLAQLPGFYGPNLHPSRRDATQLPGPPPADATEEQGPTFAGPIEPDDSEIEDPPQVARRPLPQSHATSRPSHADEFPDLPEHGDTTEPSPSEPAPVRTKLDDPETDQAVEPTTPASTRDDEPSDDADESASLGPDLEAPESVSDLPASPATEEGPELQALDSDAPQAPASLKPHQEPEVADLETGDSKTAPPLPREVPTPEFTPRSNEESPSRETTAQPVPAGTPGSPPDAAAPPAPLTAVRIFRPKHLPVATLLAEIETQLTAGVGKVAASEDASAGGPATPGTRRQPQGAIVVKDTADALQRIEALVERLDVPSVAGMEFAVEITAVGVRLGGSVREGIELEQIGQSDRGFALHSIQGGVESHDAVRCASCPGGRSAGALKLAVLTGEEHRMLQGLRTYGPLQALARSRVTMRDREASRLVVEQDDETGRPDPNRARCLGVRPVLQSDGSLRLEVLPCVDETGAPIEEGDPGQQPLGELVVQRGETAVLAGMIDEERVASRSQVRMVGGVRKSGRASLERTEWFFLVTPRIPSSKDLAKRPRQDRQVRQAAAR